MTNRTATAHASTRALTADALLDDGAGTRGASRFALVLGAMMVCLVAWSAIATLKETISVRGEIIPSGREVAVQHFYGGVVAAIHVREGDLVALGAPLIEIVDPDAPSRLERLNDRATETLLSLERIEALLDDRKPDFLARLEIEGLAEGTRSQPAGASKVSMMRHARAFLEERSAHVKAIAILEEGRGRHAAAIHGLAERRGAAEARAEAFDAQAAIDAQAPPANQIPPSDDAPDERVPDERVPDERPSGVRSGLLATRNAIDAIDAQLGQAREALARSSDERQITTSEWRRSLALEAVRLGQSFSDLMIDRSAVLQAQRAAIVRAPVTGYVKDLAANVIGAVVGAGAEIVRLVPSDDGLTVSASLPQEAVYAARSAGSVLLRITAFDLTRQPPLRGSIVSISPSTYPSRTGASNYRILIRIDPDSVPPGMTLSPGMAALADIVINERSIAGHLIRPLRQILIEAFPADA